ncbi:flippase [Citrobacter portucalensis]|uniref:flippase n=1 Tax=Citrobacter portucalensis TaxID=1639133 RepID=UPI0039FC66BA|nr:flippase [Citrobacter freundii]
MNNSIKKNILYLFLVQGSSYILPLITFPYLVRVLGVEHFGILGFSQATIQYFVLLTDYGFNWTGTQKIAKYANNKNKLSIIFWSIINAKIILLFISGILFILMIFCIPKYREIWIILLCFFPMLLGNVIYPVWLYQGLERMKWISFCTIFSRFLIIPLTFLFVNNPKDIWLAALLQSGVNFLAGLISCIILINNKWIEGYNFSWSEIKLRYTEGIHVFLSTSSISLYTVSITVILGFISGPVAVGYFNAANIVRNAAQGLLGPIFQAIFPRVNNLFDEHYEKALDLIKISVKYVGGLSLAGSCVLFFFSKYIILTVAGEDYINSVEILKWLAFVPFFISLSNIFGVQTMLSHSYKKEFSMILFFGALLNLMIIFPLVYEYSAVGAGVAIFITELFVVTTMFLFLKRKKINIF